MKNNKPLTGRERALARTMAALSREADQLESSLTATQVRCTELLTQLRVVTRDRDAMQALVTELEIRLSEALVGRV